MFQIADDIATTITGDLYGSTLVADFMTKYHIDNKKLAVAIIYHEYMYDLLDILVDKNVIARPSLWISREKRPADLAHQLFLLVPE